jgi:hypothetical protein
VFPDIPALGKFAFARRYKAGIHLKATEGSNDNEFYCHVSMTVCRLLSLSKNVHEDYAIGQI